jgi:sugar phosphate isomerase/epimerase
MKLAIQEHMLPGATVLERVKAAHKLGFEGVEFAADGLTERVEEIVAALIGVGEVQASAVYAGKTRLLHPDYAERDRAVSYLRQAMADSLDLGARGVAFIPHFTTSPALPDLRPYKSAAELEGELLVKQLHGTLVDLSYALGAELYLMPVSHEVAHLVNRLADAAELRDRLDSPQHVKLAINLCDLHMEEDDPVAALMNHGEHVAYVQVADTKRRLPGHGDADFKAHLAALRAAHYDGWLTLSCTIPNVDDPAYPDDLRAAAAVIRKAATR